MKVQKISMNNRYRILFCRRNPADAGWLYKLTPKAVFLKEFNSLEEAAKFIANNVYIPHMVGKQLNPNSKIVIWSISHLKKADLDILGAKIEAMCRKRLS